MFTKKYNTALSALLLLLSGCGGGSSDTAYGDNSGTATKGRVVKGPVALAQLSATPISPYTGEALASPTNLGATDSSGNFLVDLSSFSNPVVLQSGGGGFVDESDPNSDGGQRRQISLAVDEGLSLYRPVGLNSLSLTIFSDVVSSRAFDVAASQGISLANAFQAVRAQATAVLGFDPFTTSALDPISPPSAASQAEKQYALLIGGVAVAANQLAIRVSLGQMNAEVINALLDDLSDGAMDGFKARQALTVNGQSMPDLDFHAAIQIFRNNNAQQYQGVPLPQPDEALWQQMPLPSNAAPTASLPSSPLVVPLNGSLLFDNNLLTVADAENTAAELRYVVITPPTAGELQDGAGNPLAIGHLPQSAITYLNTDVASSDFFEIGVVDPDFGIAFVPVSLVINQPPILQDDTAQLPEDGNLLIDVLANDSDPETDALSLTGTPTASNGTVVIENNQLRFTPAANFNGTVNLSYEASDGLNAPVSASVTVTVDAVNDAPTISDVADLSIAEDSNSGSLSITLGDIDSEVNALTLSATSSNTSLLPVANIVFSGSGANRSVVFTPTADAFGVSNIDITVSDGAATAVDSLQLTVTAVNDAPTISLIGDQSTQEDNPTGTIGFVVDDIDNLQSELVLTASAGNATLLPSGAFVFSGASANRSVVVTPAFEEFGSSLVTITVSDGTLNASEPFTLTVTRDTLETERYVSKGATGDCLSPSQACGMGSIAFNNELVSGTRQFLIAQHGASPYSLPTSIQLAADVSLIGGYDAGDFSLSPSTDPSLTALESNATQTAVTDATLVCAANVPSSATVSNMEFRGSQSGTRTVALSVSADCSALFENNIFKGGAGSNEAAAVYVNGAGGTPRLLKNYVFGGNASGDTIGVIVEGGELSLEQNQIEGGISQNGDSEGVAYDTNSAGNLISNNLISGGQSLNRDSSALSFALDGSALVVNNTLYSGKAPNGNAVGVLFFEDTTVNSRPVLANNIIQADGFGSENYCFFERDNSAGQPGGFEFNRLSDCGVLYRAADYELPNVATDLTQFFELEKFFIDEGLEFFAGLHQPPPNPQPLFVNETGADANKATLLDNDWHLNANAPDCAAAFGGSSVISNGTVPTIDFDEAARQDSIIPGFCAYLAFAHLQDLQETPPTGVSIGAYEGDFNFSGVYVDAANGDDTNDCRSPANRCASLQKALAVAQVGEEIRVAEGLYGLSGATSKIDQSLSFVGGYADPSTYLGMPRCDDMSCLTQIGLDVAATGADENTVLLCDGSGASPAISPENTIIAGFAISADTGADNVAQATKAIELRAGCSAIVASNQLNGGDGGDGSEDSIGLSVIGNTLPEIVDNAIEAGLGTSAKAIGVFIDDNTLPTDQSNGIKLLHNRIKGSTDTQPNAQLSAALHIGTNAATSNTELFISENQLSGGQGIEARGLVIDGFGVANVERNRIHGGFASGSASSAVGLQLAALADISIHNNVIHAGADDLNVSRAPAFTQAVRAAAIGSSAKLALRNNTLFSGIARDTQRVIVLGAPLATGDFAEIFIDNNILFTPLSGGVDRRCIQEEKTLTPTRVANNLFYQCDDEYVDSAAGVLGANNASNNASGNIISNPQTSIPGPGFEDEDGADNDLSSEDFDWRLAPFAVVCEVAQGGLDGAAQIPPFPYNLDLEFRLRTDDQAGSGWSIGAYEQDQCAQG